MTSWDYRRIARDNLAGKWKISILTALVACDSQKTPQETEPKETTSVSAYKSTGNYPKLQGQLTWEGINSFPVVNKKMTIDEARDL